MSSAFMWYRPHTNNTCKPDLAACRLGVGASLIPVTFCGVPVLPFRADTTGPKVVLQNLTASDFERACQSELSTVTVLRANLMWCCVQVKKPPQVSSTGEWSTQVLSE